MVGAIVLSLVLAGLGLSYAKVEAAVEPVAVQRAYDDQAQECDFSHGPLMGAAWDECAHYLYEFANLSSLATTSPSVEVATQQIIDLINQISVLNNSLNSSLSQF